MGFLTCHVRAGNTVCRSAPMPTYSARRNSFSPPAGASSLSTCAAILRVRELKNGCACLPRLSSTRYSATPASPGDIRPVRAFTASVADVDPLRVQLGFALAPAEKPKTLPRFTSRWIAITLGTASMASTFVASTHRILKVLARPAAQHRFSPRSRPSSLSPSASSSTGISARLPRRALGKAVSATHGTRKTVPRTRRAAAARSTRAEEARRCTHSRTNRPWLVLFCTHAALSVALGAANVDGEGCGARPVVRRRDCFCSMESVVSLISTKNSQPFRIDRLTNFSAIEAITQDQLADSQQQGEAEPSQMQRDLFDSECAEWCVSELQLWPKRLREDEELQGRQGARQGEQFCLMVASKERQLRVQKIGLSHPKRVIYPELESSLAAADGHQWLSAAIGRRCMALCTDGLIGVRQSLAAFTGPPSLGSPADANRFHRSLLDIVE
ncbi:hypothetical protein DFH09DRAFT_1098361 [Mycena vulgaris]|nr:hypothetical protein DFH09DRAFT_1098361 [Mycena vulgaris]